MGESQEFVENIEYENHPISAAELLTITPFAIHIVTYLKYSYCISEAYAIEISTHDSKSSVKP